MTGQHKLLVTGLVCVGVVCLLPRPVTSHGRLWEPPGRGTMYKRGFNTPPDYNDNQQYCGGVHQAYAGENCGTCGDPARDPIPREHEAGGKYGLGVIAKNYTQGQRTTFTVDLTANHLGFMEFRLCPTNDKKKRATQDCLNKHLVEMADGSGTQFIPDGHKGYHDIDVILPADLTCEQCVLQWRYHAGNSWTTDDQGKHCNGCGTQEEFYGCADVRIVPSGGQATAAHTAAPAPAQTQAPTSRPGQPQTPRPTQAPTAKPQQSNSGVGCKGVGVRAGVWDSWCVETCGNGYCPDSMCVC